MIIVWTESMTLSVILYVYIYIYKYRYSPTFLFLTYKCVSCGDLIFCGAISETLGQEKFEDTERVIRSYIAKDRQ